MSHLIKIYSVCKFLSLVFNELTNDVNSFEGYCLKANKRHTPIPSKTKLRNS